MKDKGKDNRETQNMTQNPVMRHNSVIVILSFIVCYGALILGIIYFKSHRIPLGTSGILLAVLGLTPVILTLILYLVNYLIGKKIQKMGESVAEMNDFLLSHRENAEESAKKELAALTRIRVFTVLWAILLGISALGFAFVVGSFSGVVEFGILLVFYSAFLFYCSLSELWHYSFKMKPETEENELTEEEFPEIFALARRAQTRVGGKEKLRIFLVSGEESSVAIASDGTTDGIFIDIVVLNLFTEDELYAIFLHEFAHVDGRNAKNKAVSEYAQYLNDTAVPFGLFDKVKEFVYRLFRNLYRFHHMLYSFASSVEKECYADRMMLDCPQSAATALLKVEYYEFHSEERKIDDEVAPFFQAESPSENAFSEILAQFMKVFSSRRDFWNSLIEKEILARNASHPTCLSRIHALGFETIPLVTEFPDGDWKELYGKILKKANRSLYDSFGKNGEDYEKQRKTEYLEPLARVTAWEEEGKPVVAEEYADLLNDLFRISRSAEALALSEREIQELPLSASHTAYFTRGRIRLYKYDPAGMDDIYTAMEENNNYIDEGLDIIGSFCCRTGMQKELDAFRERALILNQKYHDESMMIQNISPKDHLSVEKLPDGVLEDILRYVESVSEGQVEKVYLFRKTVSESFFSSTFVLKYASGIDEEKREQIYRAVFRYLDTSSDWQYSLYEYADIPAGILDKTPGYLVWEKR